jgi:uncharacterized protein YfaS (alpha-2-macroglobulin family)
MGPRPSHATALATALAVAGGVVMHLMWAETPHGRVTGTLLTAERGAPLAGIRVSLSGGFSPNPRLCTTTDADGRFAFSHVPAGTYRLTAKTYAHEQSPDLIRVRESETFDAVFELAPSKPFLETFQTQSVFTPEEDVQLECHGFAPVNQLQLSVWTIRPDVAVSKWSGWLGEGLTTHGAQLNVANLASIPELTLFRRSAIDIKGRDLEGVFRESVDVGKLPPGMYLLAVETQDLRRFRAVVVTDLGLVVKAAPQETLVFATNIQTGQPLAGVGVELRAQGKAQGHATTDAQGLARLKLPRAESADIEVVGRHGQSMAVAQTYAYWEQHGRPLSVYTYTDRPVYRPGHAVHFKSLARRLKGNAYEVPANLKARVRVVDGRENLVYAGEHVTSAYGSVHGDFALSGNALPGEYTLSVLTEGGTYESSFRVAEYRKPDFDVTVTPEKERYARGDTVKATVGAEYFYGAPVPNAEVSWEITRSEEWYRPECEEWDTDLYEAYEPEGGQIVRSGTGRTGKDGKLRIAFDTGDAGAFPREGGNDYRYTVHVDVSDVGRRSVSGSGTVLVTQGDFRLEVRFDDYSVAPGQPATATIRAVDYDGKPVANVEGEAAFFHCEWREEAEKLGQEASPTWRTDPDGRAEVTVTPKEEGDYRLRVRVRDAAGHRITGTASLWVMRGEHASFDYPYEDFEVRADKDVYKEGETAQVVVRSRYCDKPRTALLTIESDVIHEARLVRLESQASILKVPVKPEYMPAVHVSLCFVKGKHLFSGEAILNVSRERKALVVSVASDKPEYQPGEAAVYRVKTTGTDGKPVPAEVSLGLVDEAVYRVQPDRTEDIVRFFYPKRSHLVETAFSFPEVYLDGGNKGGGNIPTRKLFPDTAFWKADLVTDTQGQAEIRLTMPDTLTTWRATCRAATLDTHVGQATYKAVVSKPFSVRLEAPRFFVQGDQARTGAIVHNLTPAPVSAEVGLEGSGLKLLGKPEREHRVAAGGTEHVEWTATAEDLGDCRTRVWADGGTVSDAMELTLPIHPKGRERSETWSPTVTGNAIYSAAIRQDCIPGTQKLTVRLAPSLAATMLGALEYLARYPYGCVEQTMSCFLPDVVIMRMLKQLRIESPALEAELPKMVQAGLLKLYDMENSGVGGWGWWQHDQPDPWMTAYVVSGLTQAKAAGFAVNQEVLDRGAEALATTKPKRPDDRAYVGYVLALAGARQRAAAIADGFAGQRGQYERAALSDWGRAMLAQLLAQLGRGDEGRALLGEVWDHFKAGKSFRSNGQQWRSDMETAAALISAASRLSPGDPRLPDLVRWLMEKRQGNRWSSTRDTAFVLYALAEYLPTSSELTPDMDVIVTVNKQQVARKRFGRQDVFRPETTLTVGADVLGKQSADVEIRKTGKGRLYCTVTLDQAVSANLNVPVRTTQGLLIERAYRTTTPAKHRRPEREERLPQREQYTFRAGEVIEAILTVRCDREFDNLMIEDLTPAGCEIMDRGVIMPWEWTYDWADQVIRDDRMAFALTHLSPGAHRLTYRMVAQIPGSYTALPPRVFDMYNPQVRGEGIAQGVEIGR